MDDQQPIRIVVEVVSSADVKRLEERDEDVRSEVVRLEQKMNALHRTIYELMEALSNLKSKH